MVSLDRCGLVGELKLDVFLLLGALAGEGGPNKQEFYWAGLTVMLFCLLAYCHPVTLVLGYNTHTQYVKDGLG